MRRAGCPRRTRRTAGSAGSGEAQETVKPRGLIGLEGPRVPSVPEGAAQVSSRDLHTSWRMFLTSRRRGARVVARNSSVIAQAWYLIQATRVFEAESKRSSS